MSIRQFHPFPSACGGRARAEHWPAGCEPSLDEVLADPLVHLVMRRDGVTPQALCGVIADARVGLRAASPASCRATRAAERAPVARQRRV
jgi:hypothetical protein